MRNFVWVHLPIAVEFDDDFCTSIKGFSVSRFYRATDASKVALVALVDWLNDSDAQLLDVQWQTDHLESLGAVEVSRRQYLQLLDAALAPPGQS